MKISNKKLMTMAVAGLLAVSAFAGCSAPAATDNNDQYIAVVGSTSVTPVATELADAYMIANPGVTIDVQGIGSSAGVKAASDKTANIGMSSRELKEEEKTWGLTEVTIAYDGIAISVHPSNPVQELTKTQVMEIFEGTITNWSQVGGEDKAILVVSREDGSGTRGAFEELVGLLAKDASGNEYSNLVADALIADGNGAVKANIASKEDSIGYLSLSYLDDSVKTVKVDGADPTVENIKNGSYSISRPFLMLLNDESGAVSQQFIDYILSDEGQAIVGEKLITVK